MLTTCRANRLADEVLRLSLQCWRTPIELEEPSIAESGGLSNQIVA